MADLALDRVQADLALGRVGLAVRVLGTVGHLMLPAGLVPRLAHLAHLAHLVGSRVTTNRVKLAQTPANPPVNPQLPTPKLNLPG